MLHPILQKSQKGYVQHISEKGISAFSYKIQLSKMVYLINLTLRMKYLLLTESQENNDKLT